MNESKMSNDKKSWQRKALSIALSFLCVSIFATGKSLAEGTAPLPTTAPSITNGLGTFQFADEKGHSIDKAITVWYYRPETLKPDSPILFVMHGVLRNAKGYCQDWIPYAKGGNCLLICPLFDDVNFPTNAYQWGNMFDDKNQPVPEQKWTFTTIENLFDYVKELSGSTDKGYFIFGHSAGGQFVHRFALFMPHARYEKAIAANPGWYTMPNYTGHKFPYGLRDSGLSEKHLRKSLSNNFMLFLGEDDIDPNDPELRKTADAEEQGPTRFARGQNYFKAAQAEAVDLKANFRWQLHTVPHAHHSDAQMAKAAAEEFFANGGSGPKG